MQNLHGNCSRRQAAKSIATDNRQTAWRGKTTWESCGWSDRKPKTWEDCAWLQPDYSRKTTHEWMPAKSWDVTAEEKNVRVSDYCPDLADSWNTTVSQELPPETRRLLPGTSVRQPQLPRLWVHIYLNKRVPDFELVPMLIGRFGCNMRNIHQQTCAKVRVRGLGSGHMEVWKKKKKSGPLKEAPVPLMMAITSVGSHIQHFRKAVELSIDTLQQIQQVFNDFCKQRGFSPAFASRESLWSFGELSDAARMALRGLPGVTLPSALPKNKRVLMLPGASDITITPVQGAFDCHGSTHELIDPNNQFPGNARWTNSLRQNICDNEFNRGADVFGRRCCNGKVGATPFTPEMPPQMTSCQVPNEDVDLCKLQAEIEGQVSAFLQDQSPVSE